jgi:predicted RNA polymerase sigma factor
LEGIVPRRLTYAVLAHVSPPGVVSLNRAVAVGMAEGPVSGLGLVDLLANDSHLAAYPQLPAVRATFLQRLGRLSEARREFERAASMTKNASEQRLYLRQASALDE